MDLQYELENEKKLSSSSNDTVLKPYVVRSSDLALQPANVNVVVSEPKEELGSELSSNSFGPTDTTRLMNTYVL